MLPECIHQGTGRKEIMYHRGNEENLRKRILTKVFVGWVKVTHKEDNKGW